MSHWELQLNSFTAIWLLALFPMSNFFSSTALYALVYGWVILLTSLCSRSLPSTALLLYASYKMCELSAEELLLNPALETNQRSWNLCLGRCLPLRSNFLWRHKHEAGPTLLIAFIFSLARARLNSYKDRHKRFFWVVVVGWGFDVVKYH